RRSWSGRGRCLARWAGAGRAVEVEPDPAGPSALPALGGQAGSLQAIRESSRGPSEVEVALVQVGDLRVGDGQHVAAAEVDHHVSVVVAHQGLEVLELVDAG